MNAPACLLATGSAVSGLLDVAAALGGPVVAVVVGDDATAAHLAEVGVDRLLHLRTAPDVPVEAVAAQVGRLVAGLAPQVVLAGSGAGDRVLLAAAADALGAPALTGVDGVRVEDGHSVVDRTVLGGIVQTTERYDGPVALVVEAGTVPATGRPAVEVEQVAADPVGLTVLETQEVTTRQVDLAAASRVVAVGRGLRAREDVDLLADLAVAARAELACSRPLAEGVDWFAKDRYVGVSGQHVAPDLYVAVGISGQLQHMAGASGAGTIVAINSDPQAPIFGQCDLGLVGDLYALVPALTAALHEGA